MLSADAPLIIDVEASGFGPTSYPIEIGLALDDGHKYCILVHQETYRRTRRAAASA